MVRVRWKIAMAALFGLATSTAPAHERWGDDPNVVVEWNEILEGVVPAAGLSPPRHYAMLHIAMFDAINSVERTHRPYRVQVRAWRGASAELAAAQAAHDILIAQFPAAHATFDAALQARIAQKNVGQVRASLDVGKRVAAAILAWRQDDGWSTPAEPFVLPELAGMYQPTPPNFGPSGFRQFQHTKPFAVITNTQYMPGPPPVITSEQYSEAFEEVKALGAEASSVRTAEQTQLAQLFASRTSSTVHWALWNHVARDTSRAKGLSLIDTARLYALLNVSIHDALQSSHSAKFIYGVWRPITAIHRANDDLNPATTADPTWKPLLTTPAYPSHPGNQSCVGASAARALALAHGTDAMHFTAKWVGSSGNPDVARNYASFWQMAEDQANGRIYGGIHFRFENVQSQQSCPRVSEYVFAHYMRRKEWAY